MKRKVTEYLAEKLIERKIISRKEKELYEYGLSAGITIIQNVLYTLLIGTIFGNITETTAFLCFYVLLRSFAGGYHAQTEKSCFWYSVLLVIVVEIIFTAMHYGQWGFFRLIAAAMASVIILCFSPLESINKPISENEKRKFKKVTFKILLGGMILLFLFVVFDMEKIGRGIEIGIVVEAMLLIIGEFEKRKRSSRV